MRPAVLHNILVRTPKWSSPPTVQYRPTNLSAGSSRANTGHHITLEDVQEHVVLGEEIHWYIYFAFDTTSANPIHSCPTKVISLENTLNGTIFPQDEIIRIAEYAHSNGLKMHLDGARIWHVAAETGTSLDVLLAPFDSVSLCFSKGLGQSSFTSHSPRHP